MTHPESELSPTPERSPRPVDRRVRRLADHS
jgi:hypothetical protein